MDVFGGGAVVGGVVATATAVLAVVLGVGRLRLVTVRFDDEMNWVIAISYPVEIAA